MGGEETYESRHYLRNSFRVVPDLESDYAFIISGRIAHYISEIPVKGEENGVKLMSLGQDDGIWRIDSYPILEAQGFMPFVLKGPDYRSGHALICEKPQVHYAATSNSAKSRA